VTPRSLLSIGLAALTAAACAPAGASYTVRIQNQDSLSLDSITIEGAGVQVAFGSVLPGQTVERGFAVRQSAVLHLNALRGQEPIRYNLGGYPGEGLGGHAEVTVLVGGQVRIRPPAPAASSPGRP